jgi:hypothetical protein
LTRARRHYPSALELAVVSAVKDAEWLKPSDMAAVKLLRYVAWDLDTQARQGSLDGTVSFDPEKVANARQLLGELGLTALARHRLGLWENAIDDAFGRILEMVPQPPGNVADEPS